MAKTVAICESAWTPGSWMPARSGGLRSADSSGGLALKQDRRRRAPSAHRVARRSRARARRLGRRPAVQSQRPGEFCWWRCWSLAAGAVAPFAWSYLQSYESTDDAQIDGHIDPLSSRIDGTVIRVHAEDDDRVKAGELLVEIDPRDYEVAVAQAKARLELALGPGRFREAGLCRRAGERS